MANPVNLVLDIHATVGVELGSQPPHWIPPHHIVEEQGDREHDQYGNDDVEDKKVTERENGRVADGDQRRGTGRRMKRVSQLHQQNGHRDGEGRGEPAKELVIEEDLVCGDANDGCDEVAED